MGYKSAYLVYGYYTLLCEDIQAMMSFESRWIDRKLHIDPIYHLSHNLLISHPQPSSPYLLLENNEAI